MKFGSIGVNGLLRAEPGIDGVPKPARCPARLYGPGSSRDDKGPGPHPHRKTETAQAHAKR